MRWTWADFEFDEQIDPEQERRFSAKKNQKWENHLPTKSTFKSVRRLILQTDPPAGFSFLILAIHQRPWTPPAGYTCVYESWFLNCSLWWPLPEFLTTYCFRRKIALGQYTANGIRILVTLTVLAAELGIKMSARLLEELTTPSITMKTGFFYGKMVPKYNVITGKPTKVNFWNHRYFYVKINEASFEDPSIILNGYFNANIDRLSKWSQGGTQSFLEEVEAIRTLSNQHWPDISEARIQAALNRITKEDEARQPSPARSPYTEGPTSNVDDVGQQEVLSQEEPLMLSPAISADSITAAVMLTEKYHAGPQATETRCEQSTKPNLAGREEEVGYPHVVDFWYQHTSVPFVEDNEEPARLFLQIQLKRKGMPELEQFSQRREDSVEDRSLKKKRKEIAELDYKCGSYEEQIDVLETEKKEAVERAELERSRNEVLSKELEELKALKEGLDTRCHNLEQENAEIVLRFETTTKRLRESREHEVRKERLRVESILKNQIAPSYDKMRQFVEEQPSIQSKLALYSQAKGIRESLEKIHSQGLSMEEILQQARADEAKYHGELQGMEVIEASEIDLTPIGIDEYGSNMAVFSPQDIEDLRS
ncbi:hypothetical protein N665_0187s0006 [Sinapis alba]|nr:hypothetical protein N665_0187s0006 [Sinapis alba]